jgi:hypothetical protein
MTKIKGYGVDAHRRHNSNIYTLPSIMRGIIEARLGDAVGMNRKVILERDGPRRLSATIAAKSIAVKRSRVSIEDIVNLL